MKEILIALMVLLLASMALAENFKDLPVCDQFRQYFGLGNNKNAPPSFNRNLCFCNITNPCNSPIDWPVE